MEYNAEFCEHGNELSGSLKAGNFFIGWVIIIINFSMKHSDNMIEINADIEE
jgi:hypothetical protein